MTTVGRTFDYTIQGQSEFNDEYRDAVEVGDDTRAIALNDERSELILRVQDAYNHWCKWRTRLEQYQWRKLKNKLTQEDLLCEDSEIQKELKDAKKWLDFWSKRFRYTESCLSEFLDVKEEDNNPPDSDMVDMTPEEKERIERYACRKFHYQEAHDVARSKEVKLECMLKRTSEKTDKVMLKRIDTLKKRQQFTGPWYFKLSMMIVKKHVDMAKAAKFALKSPEEKRVARKDPSQFWESTCDRFMNFKRINEEKAEANGREWRLPTDNYTLPVLEVEYNPEIRVITNSLSTSEDAIIAYLDHKPRQSLFLDRVMKRASKMREKRDRVSVETSATRKARINAINTDGEKATKCQ